MYKRCIVGYILQLCAIILLAWPLCALAEEPASEPETAMLIAVKQLIAAQDAWFAEHGRYADSSQLSELVNIPSITYDLYPTDGGVIHQYLAEEGQAYILVARNTEQHDFVTAEHTGEIYSDLDWELDDYAFAAVRALVYAENVMFAQNGKYGSFSELLDAELIGDDWATYISTHAYEVVCLDSGAVVGLMAQPSFPAYGVLGDGGSYQYVADSGSTEIGEYRYDDDYTTIIKEKAWNTLRALISGEAAWYASHGAYGTTEALAEEGFMDSRFAGNPVDIGDGIWILVDVSEDGQAYTAVSTVLDIMHVTSETGEIREFALGEPVADPTVEALRISASVLHEADSE